MRTTIALLVLGTAFGQDTATYRSSSVDVNGRTIEGPQITTATSKAGSVRTETLPSINGRTVPVEQISERVVRDGPIRVVERTRQRFDPDGRPGPPETTMVEQESQPGGHTTIRTTTSQRDINGNLHITERSVTETQKTGSSETSETLIERPTINGDLETVEKRSASKIGSTDAFQQIATTYRRGVNGFYEAGRVTTQTLKGQSTTTSETEEYEIGPSGSIELHGQTTRRITKNLDGSETEIVDLFGRSVPGTIGPSGAIMKLQERQIVERSNGADGSVRETLRLQRPTVTDPTVLSAPRVVSETLCKGKCHG